MHPALLLRRKKMKKEKKMKPSPLSRFLCRVRLRGMGARELPCAFFRGPSRTTCCPPSRELFVENAMTKELKKERKIRALTKQGAEPKKKRRETTYIYYMEFGQVHSLRASCSLVFLGGVSTSWGT